MIYEPHVKFSPHWEQSASVLQALQYAREAQKTSSSAPANGGMQYGQLPPQPSLFEELQTVCSAAAEVVVDVEVEVVVVVLINLVGS